MNSKKNFSRKVNRPNPRRRRARRRRRNFVVSDKQTRYGKIQTLGSGRTQLSIEKYVNYTPSQSNIEVSFKIGTILNESYEFIQTASIYRYFKILGLAVVFEPNQTEVNNQSKIYIFINWGNGETANMQFEDSSRVVPTYRTKRITMKFGVPNINIISDGTYTNPSAWYPATDTDFTYIGGYVDAQADASIIVKFKIIVNVAFAGNRVRDPSSMKKLYSDLENKFKMEKKEKVDGFELMKEEEKKKKEEEEKKKEEEEEEETSVYEGDDDFIKDLNA